METEQPAVVISVLAWNSLTHLPTCLDSLTRQTYPAKTVYVVDQASLDGTSAWMAEHFPAVHMIRNTRNVGFAHGHNQIIRLTESPFILVVNPDIVLDPDWVERAVAIMIGDKEIGAVGGKLTRYTYTDDDLKSIVPSGIIDSAGLAIHHSRHVIDRGSGTSDSGQFDTAEDVFGMTGACVMYRRIALESVRYRDEYFDDNFFAYKEDVDLAWRLQRRGWRCRYEPRLHGLHHRHAKGISATSDMLLAKSHRSRTTRIAYLSYRNHHWLLMKNETWSTFWRDAGPILWYECKKFGYLLLTKPAALRGLFHAFIHARLMRPKAELIRRQATVSALEVRRRWIT